MKQFYAHSENQNGEKEPLWKHLKKTAELAESYAKHFGEGCAGKWLGIFHDAGKASDMFQGVLEKSEHNVNHAAAGACLLNRYDQISRVIYAHHDGLIWFIKGDLKKSMDPGSQDSQNGKRFAVTGAEEYDAAKNYIERYVGIPDERPVLKEDIDSYYKALPEMLHARMLLSCLCDADYTAAASHEDENVLEYAKEVPLEAERILEKLDDHRREIISRSSADSEIVRIRNEVYESCKKAAEGPPGIFTLTAPTGTGKTLALLGFAAGHALVNKMRRIIIVLPFLSIISQNAKIYRAICGDVLEAHSASISAESDREKLLSEQWNSPVVITTAVKFFETFFKAKPSEMRFLHSITDSVIVFDEAQSIPSELMGTTLETMRALCETYGCTVLFSTATQPAFDVRSDIKFKAGEIIPDPASLYERTRRVTVQWDILSDKRTPLEDIADEMCAQNSVCCVLNRKDHTRRLFDLLTARSPAEECFYISTDMCKSHRDKVIEEITLRLKNGIPCRLVSTSCIEAGVDLDFDNMYRALAPLDSIIQCAGRCNRNGRAEGRMKVFIPDEKKLYPSTFYENAAGKVRLLMMRHPIDINDPCHIREYYELLFGDSNYDHDKRALEEALEEHDFARAEREYRFIPGRGVNVLVPYPEERELFDKLANESRSKGISKDWMRRAAPITVSSYHENKLRDIAEPCCVFSKHGAEIVHGWYILLDDMFYDDKTGLYFGDESSLEYLV